MIAIVASAVTMARLLFKIMKCPFASDRIGRLRAPSRLSQCQPGLYVDFLTDC
jgi:hypothetical protein